jgi:type VI secretion system protein ImpA
MSHESFLVPISEERPCGEDLEYDGNLFNELQAAALGKPELQVGETIKAAVPPDYRTVIEMCEALMARTRDFRVAAYWATAQVSERGFTGLNEGLDLVIGLVEQHWDQAYPLIEDQSSEIDFTARLNTIAPFADLGQIFGLLRDTVYIEQRGIASFTVRDVEVALELLPPSSTTNGSLPSLDAVKRLLTDALTENRETPLLAAQALEKVRKLDQLLDEKATIGEAPDFKDLIARLYPFARIEQECLTSFDESAADSGEIDADGNAVAGSGGALSGSIRSRSDARRAMTLACEYLERSEPSNPAAIFLRRAISLLDKSFLDIVQDLSPESLEAFKKYAPREAESESESEN